MYLEFSIDDAEQLEFKSLVAKKSFICVEGIIVKSKINGFNIVLPVDMLLLILCHQDFSTLYAFNLLFTF